MIAESCKADDEIEFRMLCEAGADLTWRWIISWSFAVASNKLQKDILTASDEKRNFNSRFFFFVS